MIRQWEVFYGKGSKRALAGERCITILEPIWTKGKNKFSFSFMRSVQSLHQKGREHYLYVIRQSSTENNVNKTCFYTCIQAPKSKQSHHQHSFVLQLNVSIYIYTKCIFLLKRNVHHLSLKFWMDLFLVPQKSMDQPGCLTTIIP